MGIIKAKVENSIIDIIDEKNIDNTGIEDVNHVGIIKNGIIYKLRNASDKRPGIYKKGLYNIIVEPDEDQAEEYKVNKDNIINFGNATNIREVISKQDKLKELENATLVSANGNIFIPLDKDNDTKEMLALKEAVRNKHIDINKYESRFGNNFNNDIRIFNKPSITLEKIKTICNALDIEVSMTFKDRDTEVPNPIGKSITTVVTGNNNDIDCDEEEESEE